LDDEHRPSASAADAATATFLFADIAGYTALTEAHGDEQAQTWSLTSSKL
jgi:class 3 adenylate cyclase